MLELRTKFRNFGNFGNFGHISDGLRKQYSVHTQCCNLIGSEPLYIPCIVLTDKNNWKIETISQKIKREESGSSMSTN